MSAVFLFMLESSFLSSLSPGREKDRGRKSGEKKGRPVAGVERGEPGEWFMALTWPCWSIIVFFEQATLMQRSYSILYLSYCFHFACFVEVIKSTDYL
jgi:hypothetical protein